MENLSEIVKVLSTKEYGWAIAEGEVVEVLRKKSGTGTPFAEIKYKLTAIDVDGAKKVFNTPKYETIRHYITSKSLKGVLNDLRRLGSEGKTPKEFGTNLVGNKIMLKYYRTDDEIKYSPYRPSVDMDDDEWDVVVDAIKNEQV